MSGELGFGIAIGLGINGLAQLEKTNDAFNRLRENAKKTSQGIKGWAADLDKYALNMKKINDLESQNLAIKGKLFNMKNLIAGGLVGTAAKLAIDFESAMADVSKVVDFANAEEEKLFGKQIKHLTRDIPLAATELASIAAAGGQMGIAKDKLVDFTTVVAKMTTAFDMGAEEAGESMAKLMNVYGLTIKEAESLGDAMNHLSDNSASKAREITEVLGRIGGNAKMFGLATDQAAALSSAMLSLGKRPEEAGTAINRFLMQLSNAPAQGKDFQDALKKIGLSAKGIKEAIEIDPQAALKDFLEKLKQVDKSQQAPIFTALMGMGFSDDLALLVGGLEQYDKALDSINNKTDYAGSMQREFAKRSQTTANQIQIMKNSLAEIGLTIGGVILPPLNKFLSAVTWGATKIADFADKHRHLTNIIMYATGIFVAFKTVSLSLLFVKNALTIATLKKANASIFSRIAMQAETTATQLSTAATLKQIAAEKWAILSKGLFVKNVGGAKGAWLGLAGGIKLGGRVISMAIRSIPIVGWIAMAVEGIVLLSNHFGGFSYLVGNVWKTIKKVFEWSPLGLIIKGWGKMFDWLGIKFGWVEGLISGISDFFGGLVDKISGFFGKVGEFFGWEYGPDATAKNQPTKVIEETQKEIRNTYAAAVAPATIAQTAEGVTVNLNGNMSIGTNPDGSFNFNEFKKQLVKATKESLKTDAVDANNRRFS